jgi:hypothetical protein
MMLLLMMIVVVMVVLLILAVIIILGVARRKLRGCQMVLWMMTIITATARTRPGISTTPTIHTTTVVVPCAARH